MTDKVTIMWEHEGGRWYSGMPPDDLQVPMGHMSRRAVDALAQQGIVFLLKIWDDGVLTVEKLGPDQEAGELVPA